jgi:hypothetical protein
MGAQEVTIRRGIAATLRGMRIVPPSSPSLNFIDDSAAVPCRRATPRRLAHRRCADSMLAPVAMSA